MQTENMAAPSKLRVGLFFGAILCALAIAACGSSSGSGSSSGDVQTLLAQTFSKGHTVKSGVLGFSLSIDPTGSSTLTTPIVFSLNGPFQSRGTGKLPASDFTVGISALNKHGSLGVISTGTNGYVTLQGAAYQLPRSDFQRLESSFSSVGSSGSTSGLSGLGINPQHWLKNPSVVGTQALNGAQTTHIRSGVNVTALLSDLNTFLAKTAKSTSSTASIPSAIPAATRQKIAAAVRNAQVDVWTGASDKTLRKLVLSLTVPVTGQTSTALGGMSSAGIGLTIQYANLNQTQTITAPSSVKPYSQFTAKLRTVLAGVQGGLGSGTGATGSGTGSTGSSAASGSSSSSSVSKYSQCIQRAGNDVLKMQKCASLLNGG
ncbi:MAG TPA: hypothetical protein VG325_01395 [Solirubrobacteraceae bacterium]|jgi:hypothetical protein|nr:hypothetical protein [Solirubrobacteraceae bacterium]